MALATTFLSPLDSSVAAVNRINEESGFNKIANLTTKRQINVKGFRVNCRVQTQQKQIEAKTASSAVDGVKQVATNGAPTTTTEKEADINTLLVHYTNDFDPYKATSTPIYQTATFHMPSAKHGGTYVYSRSGNPTRHTLEGMLAKVENAKYGYCFTSGMSALTAISELVKPGEEVLALEDIYGGSYQFLMEYIAKKDGVEVNRVDTTNLEKVKKELSRGTTRLVWIETPSNPQLKITDLRKISELAHEYGAIVFVDNSIMSPLSSKPLELGVDLVMHSGTKILSGNSNVTAGVVLTNDDQIASQLKFYNNAMGCALAPFDSWLVLEGIKTMALRVERKQDNAQTVAEYLAKHPLVTKVNYPGLTTDPGHDLHFSQSTGAGSVISFTTGSASLSQHVVENSKYFSMSSGFGGVSSAMCLPWYTSHASIPQAERESMGLTEDLVRMSVGIEKVEDLIACLDEAFQSHPAKVSFWF
nr:mimosinase-like protein [Leucaena leucocephala]